MVRWQKALQYGQMSFSHCIVIWLHLLLRRIVVVEEGWVFKEVVEMLVVLDGGGGRTSLGRDGFCWLKEGMGLVWCTVGEI